MPQISHISIKDIIRENRMDAEFHRNIFINPKLEYDYIWNLLKKNTQYWISIDMNLEWKWYKIYRMNEIENMFCNTEVEKYADIEEQEMKKFKLNDRDVLFNRTNSFEFVWRTWLFREYSDDDMVFASYLVRVNPDENKILPEYLTAFLNTKYWIFDVKRRAKISINQSNVSAEELKKVRIPIIDMGKQEIIKDLFDKAFFAKQKSKQLYQEAEDILLREIWLKEHTISHTLTFSTTKKEIDNAWRYDADYFQPKYDELIEKIENYKWGWDYVENIFKHKKWYEPWAEAYTQDGKDFIRVSDFTKFWIDWTDKKISEKLYDELKWDYQAKKWEILFTKDWTIWITYVLKEDLKWIISSAFLRLNLKEEYENQEKECLALILNSIICKLQVERFSWWALISHLKPSDFEKIKIPLINSWLQKEISDKIKESFKLRNESKQLLEQAKKMVEDEIEKE